MAEQQVPVWMHPYAGTNVLVTGAFGFLGSHLTRALAAAGAHVAAVDTATAPARVSQINLVAGLRDAIEVHTGDVTDLEFLRRVFSRRRFHYVFNFAAFASVIERATAHPTETLLVNATGIVHLLAAAVDTGQDLRCVLHASTDKIYGDHGGATYSEQSMEFRCEGVYEASKLAADVFARTYRRAYGLPVAVARMCNVFGPYDIDGMASRLVPRSLAAIFRDAGAPEVYEGSRQHRRDWLFVDDCCRALLTLAASDMAQLESAVFHVPGIAHLCTQDMCLHVIDAAASALDRAGDAQAARAVRAAGYRISPPAANAEQAIAVQHTDGERMFTHIGFRPQVSLQDGLAQTAEFYRAYFASRALPHVPGTTQNG